MNLTPVLLAMLLSAVSGPAAAGLQTPAAAGIISVIQVHGNNATPDDDVLALAGVKPGEPFTTETRSIVRRRLLDSGRFEGIEVRQRFASIADPTQIALVIIVDEHAVSVRLPDVLDGEGDPDDSPLRLVRRGWYRNVMWLPLLHAEDGYGVTYGAVVAYPGVAGERSRLAVPLSWGGHRQAGVELDRTLVTGPISRVRVGASIDQRRNPAFDEPDQRRRVWGRLERSVTPALRAGVTGAWEQVRFAAEGDRFRSITADLRFDTRVDPALPRNAVDARASWTRWAGDHNTTVDQFHTGARVYLGLVGQSVLTVRLERDTSSGPLPRYFKPLLGGWSSLRGFAAGSFVGDTRVLSSLELKIPVSSALSVAKVGLSVFVDGGRAYDYGERFDQAPVRVGAGAGLWLAATVVQAGVSVAHGRDSGTRFNVGLGVTF